MAVVVGLIVAVHVMLVVVIINSICFHIAH